ncbi:hypothetical protein C2G38_2191349 [Gigaspora rosea]|uniref:AMP-dependent synthetase/ligase domain-containing protein n=1 Tax=Gigaspora rosea TaxID=44941 RepID=A0A397V068_9GLOM|nr:hypothetical protein C2G38_2191349 [Gigaspora rosea]
MIFKSKYRDIKIPQVGIYQYVTSNPNKISEDKVIYVDGITGKSYTFSEFKHESKKFAAGLQDKLEFKCEDILAIFSHNLVHQYPELLETAIEASIDAKIPTSRLLLFGDKKIKGYKPYRSILIGDREIEPIYYTPEEANSTTAYLHSSGTTGKQKCIEHTHTSAVAMLAQRIISEYKLGPHSITMGVTQFCHSYSLGNIVHATLIHGATTIIYSSFNVKTFFESIQKFKIIHIYVVPEIILKLINNPLAQQFDLSSVDMIISGRAPLYDRLKRKFCEMFKIPILQTYGLTETSIILLPHPDTIKNAVPGSIGILAPNIKAKILSEDGHELGYNEPGELWVHGPNIMTSYFNNKEVTDNVIIKMDFLTQEILHMLINKRISLLVVEKKI